MVVKTQLLTPDTIDQAAYLLKSGECVAFPTETVYGLGANALSEHSVAKIFEAKGRPADNPLIVHCYSKQQVEGLVLYWPKQAIVLMDEFWPGPLTLVFPKKEHVPSITTGGLASVAIRIPDHQVALSLLKATQLPIAAPSANVSGRPSPTKAEHVWEDLQGRIAAILDGGQTGWGLESTVVDCTQYPFQLLRPGGVTLEQLRNFVDIELHPGVHHEIKGKPASPGMKYKHYSPKAEILLVEGQDVPATITRLLGDLKNKHNKIGVMTTDETKSSYAGVTILNMGSQFNLSEIAANIYHLLREVDKLNLDLVIIEGLGEEELGLAIMNRLRKAAGGQIVYC